MTSEDVEKHNELQTQPEYEHNNANKISLEVTAVFHPGTALTKFTTQLSRIPLLKRMFFFQTR